MSRKRTLAALLLLVLPALACSFSVDLGGETPEPTTPPLTREVPTEAIATPPPPAPPPTTPPPTPTEVATPPPTPTEGLRPDVLLEDDFSDPSSGWEVGDWEQGSAGYRDGSYFVIGRTEGRNIWAVANRSFDNVVIDVDATQISGPANHNNGYGVGCRIQSNGDGYYLRVSGDGYYAITEAADGNHEGLVDWMPSDVINQGNATNHIRAVCDGPQLALFVNGQLVAEAEDSTFQEGDITLCAGTFEEEPTEIHFDNLLVTAPGSAPRPMPTPTGPSGGLILFEDDFSDPGSGWEVGDWEHGSAGYRDGIYFVIGRTDGKNVWPVANRSFADLVIEVDATQVSAPASDNNAYGVGCRVQPDGHGYYLYISGDGYYRIAKSADGEHDALIDWTRSEVINQGNAINYIRVVCNGPHLALFVNGELLGEASDSTFVEGDVALAAATLEDEATEIHFDNLVVRAPAPG